MNSNVLKKGCLALALVVLAACSDSTGSGNVTSEDALQSLSRGFGAGSGVALPFGMPSSALGRAASLGQVDVTLDGTARRMYALGLRVTYPAGTCFESLFVIPSVTFPPGRCSPPPLGLLLVMWQTRSGSRPPDRLIVLTGDVGTTDFTFPDLASDVPYFPSLGIYIDSDREEFWSTVGGTLTSQVTATNQTCDAPPPPFARTSTCHIATFAESGRITFELFDFTLHGGLSAPRTADLVIPQQNILGIVQAITEIRPVTLPSLTAVRGF